MSETITTYTTSEECLRAAGINYNSESPQTNIFPNITDVDQYRAEAYGEMYPFTQGNADVHYIAKNIEKKMVVARIFRAFPAEKRPADYSTKDCDLSETDKNILKTQIQSDFFSGHGSWIPNDNANV